jgi:hypothetical protein
MNVYLVPASSTRHALYCEVATSADVAGDLGTRSGTFFDRMKERFRRAVDEGERAERGGGRGDDERSRLRRLITRKLAEAVAEQRLLWHLRHESAAVLVHPDRLSGDAAMRLAREEFGGDYARHRRWMVIDGVITLVTGPLLFFVPGPNIVSWYFTFRAIGHFLSMRGAGRALSAVTWTQQGSPHLTSVGDALGVDAATRSARVEAAAAALGLERLAPFVERIADKTI